ncbi:MAG: DNA-binding transcriptional regulator [Xanthomonadales bacterium]|nr:DNA-binding transcriptional regulator [Xanthomonadales bacterium]
MKRRALPTEQDEGAAVLMLSRAFHALRSADEVAAFLRDLCTPAEIEAMADRWSVVPHLLDGEAYRDIHDQTGVSVTTVGRVARCLAHGQGYRAAARRLGLRRARLDTPDAHR